MLLTACAEKGDFSDWNSYVGSTKDLIDLREANLENLKIVGAKFQNAQGEGANFNEAILAGAVLDGVDLSGSHFLNAELTGVKVSGSAFHDCIFDRAKLSAGTFTMCNFNGSRFHSAKLISVEFWESHFQDSSFYAADLSDAKFYGGGYNPIARKELRFNLFGTSFKTQNSRAQHIFTWLMCRARRTFEPLVLKVLVIQLGCVRVFSIVIGGTTGMIGVRIMG